MSIIGWLIVAEAVVAVGLLVWYARHAHRHVKKSPAEEALRRHLEELEAARVAKQQEAPKPVTAKVRKKAKQK